MKVGPIVASSPPTTPAANALAQARAAQILSDWRMTPATLMSKLNPWWIPSRWLQYLSFEIAHAISKGNCGLLISAPPRHGKSKLSTVATPLWALENFPRKNIIVATYGEDLSTDFSREIRDTIEQNPDLLNVRLRADTKRVQNFLTTQGGGLKAVGLRGAITGRGADILVIDDYIKEPKEAMSPTYLEDLWTWWLTVARTRLEPGAVVIILATRWVAEDLHGRLMRQQKLQNRSFFKYINMPAIYEPTMPQEASDGRTIHVPDYEARDFLGRKYGDVLFPERYDADAINDIRIDLTNRWFSAMFQQDPLSDDNVVVNLNWFKRITRSEFRKRVVDLNNDPNQKLQWGRGWDMASTKEAGDYTSGPRGLFHKNTGDLYIESMKRGQWSAATAEFEFSKAVEEDFELDSDFKIGMEQEPGSSGKYSVRHFEKLAKEKVKGSSVKEFPSTTSKLLRATTFLAALEHGHVYIVVDHDEDLHADDINDLKTVWVREYFEELKIFPEAPHDDQMDGSVVLYQNLSGKVSLKASIGRKMDKNGKSVDVLGGIPGHQPPATHRKSVTFGRRQGLISGLGRPSGISGVRRVRTNPNAIGDL
jgi:predicted phage terminase large subunit-like protein